MAVSTILSPSIVSNRPLPYRTEPKYLGPTMCRLHDLGLGIQAFGVGRSTGQGLRVQGFGIRVALAEGSQGSSSLNLKLLVKVHYKWK